jgi:hypothetical protein
MSDALQAVRSALTGRASDKIQERLLGMCRAVSSKDDLQRIEQLLSISPQSLRDDPVVRQAVDAAIQVAAIKVPIP